jgi:glycosyltransferase involved in cell wall biosynthesis
MKKIAFVTNVPAPYRIPIFNRLAQTPGFRFHAIFCCQREPNRTWSLPPMGFEHTFLRERFSTVNNRYIHNNLDVIPALKRLSPDLIITDGFNPTHLYAFGYAIAKKVSHITMTDGTFDSEKSLSTLHRLVRRFVYRRTGAFLSASMGGKKLYESYGIPENRCFRSCLCVDNLAFLPEAEKEQKQFDFIFCGRIESVKNPVFAQNVAIEVANKLKRRVKLLFVGSGSLEPTLKKMADMYPEQLEVTFNGFATQEELPALYRSARIFIFPTLWDPWGVVVNEACAAGLPILVSPHAGAAGELVLNGENGFVCDLDVNRWVEHATLLLTQPKIYRKFSDRSRSLVSKYTFEDASSGILTACRYATLANGVC